MPVSSISTHTLKAIVVASIALFFTFIVFNNVTDFSTNQSIVQSVLSMEVVSSKQVLWRAIHNPYVQNTVYVLMILIEAIIAVICWIAATRLFLYKSGTQLALLGFTLGFALFTIVFLTFGGEWFYLWKHPIIGAMQQKAAIFALLMLAGMIYLSLG